MRQGDHQVGHWPTFYSFISLYRTQAGVNRIRQLVVSAAFAGHDPVQKAARLTFRTVQRAHVVNRRQYSARAVVVHLHYIVTCRDGDVTVYSSSGSSSNSCCQPGGTYDVSHVIDHVPHDVNTARGCRRVNCSKPYPTTFTLIVLINASAASATGWPITGHAAL